MPLCPFPSLPCWTLPWYIQLCKATPVPQTGAGQIKLPELARGGHFLPQSHVPSPLLLHSTLASKPASYLLSSKVFPVSLPGTTGFLLPFLDVPSSGDILHSSVQSQPSRLLHNLGQTPRLGSWSAFPTGLLRTSPTGNLFIPFAVPCAIGVKPGRWPPAKHGVLCVSPSLLRGLVTTSHIYFYRSSQEEGDLGVMPTPAALPGGGLSQNPVRAAGEEQEGFRHGTAAAWMPARRALAC